MKSFEARADFIRANTEILVPPLVPEIKLHLAHEAVPLWEKTEEQLGELGLPPPFWAFAWAGGQALARYVLDNPMCVKNRRVIDLASGSGLVGLAAMKAGAASVLAADIDEFAVVAMELNHTLNRHPGFRGGHALTSFVVSNAAGPSLATEGPLPRLRRTLPRGEGPLAAISHFTVQGARTTGPSPPGLRHARK